MPENPLSAVTSAVIALGTAMGQAKPAFQAAGETMTEVSRRLREQIAALRQDTQTRRLSPPFADIRFILMSGETYDVDGNYLLTLTSEGIEDLFRRLSVVEIRETLDGPVLRHKNRFLSEVPAVRPAVFSEQPAGVHGAHLTHYTRRRTTDGMPGL